MQAEQRDHGEADLQQLHDVGPKALEQLRRALAACGLSFARGLHS
jgi:hypothetical protein